MITDKILRAVSTAALEALLAAREEHGDYFGSSHEGVAVIAEEVEEMLAEADAVKKRLDVMWEGVKHDMEREEQDAGELYNRARACAAECSQIMAMCQKMIETMENVR